MRAFIQIAGARVVERKFAHVAATRQNMRTILEGPVADVIFDIEEQIFNSQGRRGGGSWKALTPGWLSYKMKHGLDPRIGHATLALRRAFTQRGAAHQQLSATSQALRISANLPYEGTQQRHRPFVKFTREDKREIAQLIRQELVAAWRNG